ncbi:Hydrogenase-4 component B [Achromobacter xylosoxidans]|uniref:proton-conducting transporter transmembrane domain-containing protein n=1 Tax=Alcaligenes xylosoxydans xylosoxydans TaxID=85698 RepID=UPI0006BFEAE2|nr:proton-conducting transporter membrane subunit [Achromobacter xylosoxidans]CUI93630.1 Hydrogenase-4 component B [Achromobacter xylosoxidans]CUJ19930.1 Hydrogenase-4 component B [Achromobacter xylosoxidans]
MAASIIAFLGSLALLPLTLSGPRLFLKGYVILDALGAWVLLCVGSVYLLGSIYAIGYMRTLSSQSHLHRFYALYAGFGLTTLAGPLMNNVGVYWIVIELTTLISTFLVCFELGRESIEAAWKYIVVVSAGISLALLGTILYYWGGSLLIGQTYDMTWAALREVAPRMDPMIGLTAFLLVIVGFGTKVGLAPMHTWLPDAHSEGPTPVSVMLSGALLNTAMVGIVRYLQISDAAGLGVLPRLVVVALGALSLLIAALFIVRQTGIKRLLAYSSIEHMGVLALGFGFGGPLGIAGALYHMLNHSLNKSLMFFGAGNVMRVWHTRRIGAIRGVAQRLPVSGWLWLAGAVAITGAPPFGLFLSEITILRAGLAGPYGWAAYAMAVLLIVIFIGFLNHFRAMFFESPAVAEADEPTNESPVARDIGFPGLWCTVPMWLAFFPLLTLGLWWPQGFTRVFEAAIQSLAAGGAP